jgi:hypothetical protein
MGRPKHRNAILAIIILWGIILVGSLTTALSQGQAPQTADDFLKGLPEPWRTNATLKLDVTAILKGYPGYLRGLETAAGDQVVLVLKDGTKIVYDDGKAKSFEAKLDNPDMEDMLSQIYPSGKPQAVAPDSDPGRFRVQAFLDSVYGGSTAQVTAHLVPVSFAGASVQFNSQNGAAAALALVGQELAALLKETPGLKAAVFPLGGTFNRRTIAGTKRLSPHSWGIAVDLNPQRGAYWQWAKGKSPAEVTKLREGYPYEIIKIFEKHGFIWGGKWAHFDTMHFEYRPELAAKAELTQPDRNGAASPPRPNPGAPAPAQK